MLFQIMRERLKKMYLCNSKKNERKRQRMTTNTFLEQPRRGKTREALITPHKAKPQCGAPATKKPQCVGLEKT